MLTYDQLIKSDASNPEAVKALTGLLGIPTGGGADFYSDPKIFKDQLANFQRIIGEQVAGTRGSSPSGEFQKFGEYSAWGGDVAPLQAQLKGLQDKYATAGVDFNSSPLSVLNKIAGLSPTLTPEQNGSRVTSNNYAGGEFGQVTPTTTTTTTPTTTIPTTTPTTTTAVPFISTMSETQRAGVNDLVNSGRAFSSVDAKNYAFATGQADSSQFVGKTGAEILAAIPKTNTSQAPSGGTIYTVKGGDTLNGLASKFGTTLADILTANPDIKNANLIYPNQKVVIPAVNSKQNDNTQINNVQNDIKKTLDKTTNTDTSSLFKDVATPETPTISEFKIPSQLETYNKLMNTPDITSEKSKIIEIDAKLKDIDLQEMNLEADIRKEVEGEAPTSLIRAMVAEKAKLFYPQKIALQNEKTALQTKLTNDLENAKAQFQLTISDQENGLKYIQSLVDSGVKLTAEQYVLSDKALGYGTGFTKMLVQTQEKSQASKNQEDQIKLIDNIFTLLNKVPEGQKVTINGLEYEGLKDAGNLVVKEYDTKTKIATSVTFDKNGKIISSEQQRISSTGATPATTKPKPTTPITPKFNEKVELTNIQKAAASVIGADGKIAPWDYLALRNTFINRGGNPTTFDTKMKGFRDPSNPSYPVGK